MTDERIAELRARWTKPPHPVVIELLDALETDNAPLYTDRIANLERERDAATERAERAEALAMAREIGADLSASEVQRAEQQIATLTRERDDAQTGSKVWREEVARLTRELEAERVGSAAMREALTELFNAQGNASGTYLRDVIKRAEKALSSTAGAKMLDELKCAGNREQFLLGRLRKAEADRGQFASCWAKAETALNDMEIAKNERITTLEADLAVMQQAAGLVFDRLHESGRDMEECNYIWRPLHQALEAKSVGGLQILERLQKAEATVSLLSNNDGYIAELELALEEARKAGDPFYRFACMRLALPPKNQLCDSTPLRDVLPGSWPTVADLNTLHAAHERIGRLMPEWKP